jgi:hypothetical protein
VGDGRGVAVDAGDGLGAALAGGLAAAADCVDAPGVDATDPPDAGPGAPGPRERRSAPRAAPTITTVAGAARRRTPSFSRVAVSGPRSTMTGSVETNRLSARAGT